MCHNLIHNMGHTQTSIHTHTIHDISVFDANLFMIYEMLILFNLNDVDSLISNVESIV